MKRLLIFLLVILVSFFSGSPVHAHGSDLPPFFKINGLLTPDSPFQTGGVYTTAFAVPQDLAPQNYLKNTDITFEIDTSSLEAVLPKEVVAKTTFSWDFGDNSKGTGTKNTHQYKNIGSYTLSITADYHQPDLTVPQFIESVQLNILPNKDYQPPQAVIKINGRKVDQPLNGSLDIDLNNRLNFDAGDSKSPSSRIVQYLWDFDDGKVGSEKTITHRYKLPQYYVSPSLMVKDANGFVSYTFTDVQNSGKNNPNNPDTEDFKDNLYKSAPIALVGIILLFGGSFFLFRSKNKAE